MRPMHPNRVIARAQGHKTFIGTPCKHGHEPVRYTSVGQCVACSKRDRSQAVSLMGDMPTFVMLRDWSVVTP